MDQSLLIIRPLIRVIHPRIQVHLIQAPDIHLTPELIRGILHLQDILPIAAALTAATAVMEDTVLIAAALIAVTALIAAVLTVATAVTEDTVPIVAALTAATAVMVAPGDTAPIAVMEHMANMGGLLPIIADMALPVVMDYLPLVDFMEVYPASAALMGDLL